MASNRYYKAVLAAKEIIDTLLDGGDAYDMVDTVVGLLPLMSELDAAALAATLECGEVVEPLVNLPYYCMPATSTVCEMGEQTALDRYRSCANRLHVYDQATVDAHYNQTGEVLDDDQVSHSYPLRVVPA
jgi:hypothetical protein